MRGREEHRREASRLQSFVVSFARVNPRDGPKNAQSCTLSSRPHAHSPAAAVTCEVRVDVRAPSLRPVPAQHEQTLSVVDAIVAHTGATSSERRPSPNRSAIARSELHVRQSQANRSPFLSLKTKKKLFSLSLLIRCRCPPARQRVAAPETMSSVTPEEPESKTCGDAMNHAWVCYCECVTLLSSRPLLPQEQK